MASQIKTFSTPGTFISMFEAEQFLRGAGFSVGSSCIGEPRCIMFGDYHIAKWRNLTSAERRGCHGQMTGDMREGPIKIEIFDTAPEDARRAFHIAATQYEAA